MATAGDRQPGSIEHLVAWDQVSQMARFALCLLVCLLFLPNPSSASDRSQHSAIRGPLVVSERWPSSTDLRTWTQDVMRIEGLENASENAQGKAFFRWLRLFSRMATGGMIQAYEGPYRQ